MQTERRKIRQTIQQFFELKHQVLPDDDWCNELADRIIGVFDTTRPINRYREDAAIKGIDLTGYPEDVAQTIWVVCELWNLRPPRREKERSFWIDAARSLNDACGEFGHNAIRVYRDNFIDYMAQHKGIAPHTVEGPGSLIKAVRAYSGTLRFSGQEQKPAQDGSFYG